jgi:hypothetical protein
MDNLFTLLEVYLKVEWVYEGRVEAPNSRRVEEQLIPPPKEKMEVLLDLAMRGNMRGIREQAEQIAQLDEKYLPFASKLEESARNYEEKAILSLLKELMQGEASKHKEYS